MINVSLPNGQKLNFPDGTSEDEMREAIDSNFPEYSKEKAQASLKEGGSSIQGKSLDEMKKMLSINFPRENKKPSHLDYENPEDIGRSEGAKQLFKLLGRHGPELAASLLVPEVPVVGALSKIPALARALKAAPTAAKYGQTIAGNALSQAGVAAAFNPSTAKESALTAGGITAPIAGLSQLALTNNPKLKLAARLGMGGLGGALGYTAGQQLRGLPFGEKIPAALGAGGAALGFYGAPMSKLRNDLMKGLEGTEYKQTLEASKRLGLPYLTPAEASGNPFLGAQQGNIGRTIEGSRNLYKKGQERLESESKSIADLLENVYKPETLDPMKRALYNESYSIKVPKEFIEKISKNDIVKKAENILEGNPAFRQELKNVPKDSLHYWDLVKRSIDDMETRAASKASKNESRIIKNTRSELVDELDKLSPTYKDARSLAEREKTRETLEETFNKKSMIGTHMYKALEDKSKFDKLLHNLRDVPDAQKRLKDMRLVFKNLINTPTVRTASQLEKTSMYDPRNLLKASLIQAKQALTLGKYDKAAVELITNPKWSAELERLAREKPTQRTISKAIKLFGKATAQTAAQPNLNINFRYNQPTPEEGEMDFEYE